MLEKEFVDNNLEGIRLEKTNQIGKAIKLYEQNINNKFDGDHPYERLRIIYARQGKRADAVRVCQAYIQNVHQDKKLQEKYKKIILKLQAK